jgi:hypothetical protein
LDFWIFSKKYAESFLGDIHHEIFLQNKNVKCVAFVMKKEWESLQKLGKFSTTCRQLSTIFPNKQTNIRQLFFDERTSISIKFILS